MQVCVDVTYVYINFGGCDLSGFRDIATFKNGQISLYSPWSSKKFNRLELAQKIHASMR